MATIKKNFSSEDVEWKDLEEFGITRAMFNDIPWNLQAPFFHGGFSPIIKLNIPSTDPNGKSSSLPFRLYLEQPDPDKAALRIRFMPWQIDMSSDKLTEQQVSELKAGKVIEVEVEDNKKQICHLDKALNQVISMPEEILKNNLDNLRLKMGFSEEEISSLLSGNIVEIQSPQNEPLSVGLDLFSPTAIRIEECSEQEWNKRERRGSRFNFGLDGCWVEDNQGVLSYVPEDEYTEEMLAEFNNPSHGIHRR